MTIKSNHRQNRRRHSSPRSIPILPYNPKAIPPILAKTAEVFLEAHLKDFDCFAEKMLKTCQPEYHFLIKPIYLKARQSREFREYLAEMDSPEAVQNYNLDEKYQQMLKDFGPSLTPPLPILNPGEVLMETPFLIMASENQQPANFSEALNGLRKLWQRILKLMRDDKLDLSRMENTLNSKIQEQGGWQRINLQDESYLNLLNPDIVNTPGWGTSPAKYLDALEQSMTAPQIVRRFESDNPLDLKMNFELTMLFHEPLSPPDQWHFQPQTKRTMPGSRQPD